MDGERALINSMESMQFNGNAITILMNSENPPAGVQYWTFWARLGVKRGDSDYKIAKIDFRKSIFDFSEPETGRLGLLGLLGLQ